LHRPVAGFSAYPELQEHVPFGRHWPWIDEIAGSSLQVQSCVGVQTHWLRNAFGQHQPTELIGCDVHPASRNGSMTLTPAPVHLHWTGGSGAVQAVDQREQPVMQWAPPSLAEPASCTELTPLSFATLASCEEAAWPSRTRLSFDSLASCAVLAHPSGSAASSRLPDSCSEPGLPASAAMVPPQPRARAAETSTNAGRHIAQ
jgi:hypothetical protein